jgi:transposase
MKKYSTEFKGSIIARMLPPNNVSVPELSKETGIPKDTLYTWRIKHRKSNCRKQQADCAQISDMSSEEKYCIVVETASMNEQELSVYCRRKGLFAEQIKAWRAECMKANAHKSEKGVNGTIIRKQSQKIKSLESELRRKEKALAETAALLVLKKKVQEIFAEQEDEK